MKNSKSIKHQEPIKKPIKRMKFSKSPVLPNKNSTKFFTKRIQKVNKNWKTNWGNNWRKYKSNNINYEVRVSTPGIRTNSQSTTRVSKINTFLLKRNNIMTPRIKTRSKLSPQKSKFLSSIGSSKNIMRSSLK